MTTVEKAAYLKGLADGLGYTADSKEGKLWDALCDIVADMAHEIEDLQVNNIDMGEALNDLTESVNVLEELTADLDLDEELWDDEDDGDEDFGCAGCPGCVRFGGDKDDDDYLNIAPDEEDMLQEGDEILDYDGIIYDAECPKCGEKISFGEDTLEKGFITCPGCGELLEFDPDAEV